MTDKEPPFLKAGEKIRKARKKHSITLKEFAKALGVSRQTIDRIQKGTKPLREPEMRVIVEFLSLYEEEAWLRREYGLTEPDQSSMSSPTRDDDLVTGYNEWLDERLDRTLRGTINPEHALTQANEIYGKAWNWLHDSERANRKTQQQIRLVMAKCKLLAIVASTMLLDKKRIYQRTRIDLSKVDTFSELMSEASRLCRDLRYIAPAMINHVSGRYPISSLQYQDALKHITDQFVLSIILRDMWVESVVLDNGALQNIAKREQESAITEGKLSRVGKAKIYEGLATAERGTLQQRRAWLQQADRLYHEQDEAIPFVRSQILRTNIKLTLAERPIGVESILQEVEEAIEKFRNQGYLRFIIQVAEMLLNTGDISLKEKGESILRSMGLSQEDI